MSMYSRALFGAQLTETPKKQTDKQIHGYDQEHGWAFLSNDCRDAKAVRTYKTLFAVSSDYTYFTPNTFYRNDKRNEVSLRWLNTMVIDIDVKDNEENKGMSCADVLDRVERAGLPEPSLVVQTPSGGFHVYFYFEYAKRAFPATLGFYKRIQQEIAIGIGGDLCAIGAERWFRIPTSDNVIYESTNRVNFQELVDWMIIEQEGHRPGMPVTFTRESLLSHPAILRLLEGVAKGKRDNTCYTLALAFKAAGYSRETTEMRLREWNEKLEDPMWILDVKRKVRSAFQGSKKGPAAAYIRMLSGMAFTYRPLEGAKPREERKYSHMNEWAEDVLKYLTANHGTIKGSQRQLSEEIGVPYSSFKIVLQQLQEARKIAIDVQGKGRGAKTTITLVEAMQNLEVTNKQDQQQIQHTYEIPNASKVVEFPILKNEPNPYTLKDMVVGGQSLVPLCGIPVTSYSTGLLDCLPSNLQDYIHAISDCSWLPPDLVAYIYFYLEEVFGNLPHVSLYELLTTNGFCSYCRIEDLLVYVWYEMKKYLQEEIG